MPTAGLLRTNPKLTSNVKIVVDTDDNVYLDVIATNNLSHNRFSRIKTNSDNKLSHDLYKFFGKGTVPNSIIYEIQRISSDNDVVTNLDYQFEHQYNYGAQKCATNLYNGSNCIFAPLLVDKGMPKYFAIFEIKGAKSFKFEKNPKILFKDVKYRFVGDPGSTVSYNNNIYVPGQNFVTTDGGGSVYVVNGNGYITVDDSDFEAKYALDIKNIRKEFISDSEIVKIFDLTNSNIGKYLNNHITDNNFTTNPIYVDFQKKEITYTGSNIKNGVISKITERISGLIDKEKSIIDFDEYITQGFERNGLISPNIFNLEFCFDTDTDGEINRYFGLYLDDIDLAEFVYDHRLISRGNKYHNPYFDNSGINIPLNYNTQVSDDGGIEIANESVISGFFPLNIHQKDSIYYVKNKFGGLHKVNNDNSQNGFRLNKKTIESSDFVGFDESVDIKAEYSAVKGKSIATIRTSDYTITTGFKISILYRGVYKGHIYGDHLPTLGLPYGNGDNYSFYFYPYGTNDEIAKAIAKAFASKFKNLVHLSATADGDEVLIHSTVAGIFANDYKILIENYSNNESFVIDFCGGTETKINRILVAKDYNKQITKESYILTNKGYTKIRDISNCLEDSNNKMAISSLDDNAAIIIEHGHARIYNKATCKFGVFHVYELADFDFDFHESSYSKSYYNEYLKYFSVKTLKAGRTYKLFGFGELNASIRYSPDQYFSFILNSKDNNIAYTDFVHKINPATFQIYVGTEGYILDYNTLNFTRISDGATIFYSDVAFEQNQGLINGFDVEWDFVDTNGNSYTFVFSPSLANTEFDPGIIMNNWSYFTSNGIGPAFYDISFQRVISGRGCYFVLLANTLYPSLPLMNWLPFDYLTDTIYQPDIPFTTTNVTDYQILSGDPYFIETKYLNDEELKKFTGFNSMTFRNRYLDVSDPDLVENKIKIFDKESAVTEYDKLFENMASKNVLKSRIVPSINKWVINGKNVREDEYRLNISHIFGELNFSPSFIDDVQNPFYFTHEWLYLVGIPDGITIDDLKKSDSYFSRPFDELQLANETDDYFTKYFTIDEHVIKNDLLVYETIAVPHQIKYSIFEKISNSKYVTFFRGVRIELASDGIDYSDWKFSAILNIKKTNQLIYEEPFSINVVQNSQFKNITYIVNIIIDDYKILDQNGEVRPDFLYLYIMNSLKYYNQQLNSYGYGINFDYPSIPGITLLRDSSPVTEYRGYRLPIKTNFTGLSNPDYLKFAKKYAVSDYLLPVNGSIGRIIGIDNQDAFIITSENAFISTGNYAVDRPTTAIRIINDELLLRSSGITMINIPSLSVYGNLNPFGVNFGVYDLASISWYHENGGQDVYKIISKLISFASLYKLTNERSELINYMETRNGSLQTVTQKIGIQFSKPNPIDKYSILTVNEIKKQIPKITDSIVTDYEQIQTQIDPKTYYRYSGNYKPKLKKIFWFKTDKLELAFGNVGKKWSDMKFMWSDMNYDITYDDSNINNIDIPYSFKLRGYNTMFDFSIDKFGYITNMYYHKSSNDKILKLDEPIYKSVDEIAIDRKNQSVFLSDWDAKYYRKYMTKNSFSDVDGYQSFIDSKSFLGSKIFSIKKEFLISVDQDKIINQPITNLTDMGDKHVIWYKDGKEWYFKISGKNMFLDYMVSNYFDEFMTYFKDSTVDAFKRYIETNILKTVSIDDVIFYTGIYGTDDYNFDNETDELVLINRGFSRTKTIKNVFDSNMLTLNTTYKQVIDGFPIFNIKLKITT